MKGGIVLLVAVCVALLAPGAEASPTARSVIAGDKNHVGNGAHNHNALSIRSPTFNTGFQPISNANAGGVTNSRHAFCKKVRFCKIHQSGAIVFP
jgi:hypothetical protein